MINKSTWRRESRAGTWTFVLQGKGDYGREESLIFLDIGPNTSMVWRSPDLAVRDMEFFLFLISFGSLTGS